MDFESPDEIERSFNKRHPAKKTEPFDISPKKPKHEEIFHKEPYENFEMDESGSEYNSDYEPTANTTESSIGSLESESDYDNNEGGFKRLDANTKKKLVIKDGKIVKPDKLKGRDKEHFANFNKSLSKGASKSGSKKTPSKTSPVSLSSLHLNLGNYENSDISPPSPRGKDAPFRVSGIKPIDVAAHLKLLGESLTIIGERLKEHEGQIAVSGSLSVLLDSLLCALGPLLCLTQLIPELQDDCCTPEQLINTLDNVAFIMPGL